MLMGGEGSTIEVTSNDITLNLYAEFYTFLSFFLIKVFYLLLYYRTACCSAL